MSDPLHDAFWPKRDVVWPAQLPSHPGAKAQVDRELRMLRNRAKKRRQMRRMRA